jgi:hypothetical protein
LLAGLAAAVAAGVVWWVLSYRPWEAHYRGRPTSWWARELVAVYEKERALKDSLIEQGPNAVAPPPQWWNEWLKLVGIQTELTGDDWELLLSSDPDAIPVLLELLRHPDGLVRAIAAVNNHEELDVARPTIVALAQIVAHPQDESWRDRAATSLEFRFRYQREQFDAALLASVAESLAGAVRDEKGTRWTAAGRALHTIDPEAACRAGVQVPNP